MSTVDDLVTAAGKAWVDHGLRGQDWARWQIRWLATRLAAAQEREGYWMEWYALGEEAAACGGAAPEIVARAKELRRMLGLENVTVTKESP